MVITEEELRQAWQNGKGQIPSFPPGTRFTPAAQDVLKAREPAVLAAAAPPPAPARAAAPGGPKRLQAPPGRRLVYTTADLPELLEGCPAALAVHPSVTLTHALLERVRGAGVRVLPWTEPDPPAAAEPASAPAGVDAEALDRIKRAVVARLDGAVDPALLDAVLRRVLASLG
jgi:hypothetical protein